MLLTPPRTVHARMRMIWIHAAATSWSPLPRWRTVSIASKKCVLASTAHTLIWPFPALTSHVFNKRGFFDFSHERSAAQTVPVTRPGLLGTPGLVFYSGKQSGTLPNVLSAVMRASG